MRKESVYEKIREYSPNILDGTASALCFTSAVIGGGIYNSSNLFNAGVGTLFLRDSIRRRNLPYIKNVPFYTAVSEGLYSAVEFKLVMSMASAGFGIDLLCKGAKDAGQAAIVFSSGLAVSALSSAIRKRRAKSLEKKVCETVKNTY